MTNSSALTHGIRVDVQARFLAEQSAPEDGQWFFVYHIRIINEGERTVQLLSREWHITNAHGRVEIVQGPGVVGHQPTMRPSEGFEYASGCPLDTPFGSMKGKYIMACEDGERLEVDIAEFALVDPMAVN
jgi:ApaG protein